MSRPCPNRFTGTYSRDMNETGCLGAGCPTTTLPTSSLSQSQRPCEETFPHQALCDSLSRLGFNSAHEKRVRNKISRLEYLGAEAERRHFPSTAGCLCLWWCLRVQERPKTFK